MGLGIQIFILFSCIVLSACFSAAEVALITLSEARVRTMVAKKRASATIIKRLKDSPQRMLTAILIGNNVVNIAAASLMTVIMVSVFGNYGVGVATGITTLLVLVFGEITPKALAARYNESVAQVLSPLIWIIAVVLKPIVSVFDLFINAFLGMFGLENTENKVTEDEIKSMVSIARKEGSITENERRLIDKVFAFDEKVVGEIITPRADMVSISAKSTVGSALRLIAKERHSRVPVYDGQKDNIVGVVYIRDLLGMPKGTQVRKAMRPPYIVPESKPISDLLQRFQKRKEHVAIVVEEHGLVIGLVTLEDVLEEIVGEIIDETEREDPEVVAVDSGWLVQAGLAISDANERLGLQIPDGDYTTIGGFLLDKLGRIPKRGERMRHHEVTYIAEEVSRQRIQMVRIMKAAK